MVTKIFFILALLPCVVFGQENNSGYKNILRTQGTLSVGYNTAFKSMNYYIHGDLEYYLNNKISIKADVFYFLNSKTKNDPIEPFKNHHTLMLGTQYHFLSGKLDFYAGIQPGLSIGQRQYNELQNYDQATLPLPAPQKSFAALVGINTGVNYYATKFFHLFVNTRYNYGWLSDNYTIASLSEFRVSFGLGYYIKLQKKHIGI